ncbi:hypothetical protein YQE_11824, partial [Dendroctonus ponderosae]
MLRLLFFVLSLAAPKSAITDLRMERSRLVKAAPDRYNCTVYSHEDDFEVHCRGNGLGQIPSSLNSSLNKLIISESKNISLISNTALNPYKMGLQDVTLSDLPHLRPDREHWPTRRSPTILPSTGKYNVFTVSIRSGPQQDRAIAQQFDQSIGSASAHHRQPETNATGRVCFQRVAQLEGVRFIVLVHKNTLLSRAGVFGSTQDTKHPDTSHYSQPSLKLAKLTHHFHCCAFQYPKQHSPIKHAAYEESMRQVCIKSQMSFQTTGFKKRKRAVEYANTYM